MQEDSPPVVLLQAHKYDSKDRTFIWDDGTPRRTIRHEALVSAHQFSMISAKGTLMSLGGMVVLRDNDSVQNMRSGNLLYSLIAKYFSIY